ncbi:phospholipid methyltransferase-domain-containing protein [Globomyces pollinis-pini]|nr:phospholipid methyltransferase-domain-containing protein [Globomyces pollinis-pini]
MEHSNYGDFKILNQEFIDNIKFNQDFYIAVAAIVFHLVNSNLTAIIERKTRFFTNKLGVNAIYYYAVYLISSALIRDYLIYRAIQSDTLNLHYPNSPMAIVIFVTGLGLNLWVLRILGIKGMFNGDSFGYLLDAPVKTGPYRFLTDPQYVGTTMCVQAAAILYNSFSGFILSIIMYITFVISVELIEKPYMNWVYDKKVSDSKKKK